MAVPIGPFTFRNRLGGMVGYQFNGNNFVRMASHIPKTRWLHHRNFARSRENAALFGGASMLGSSIYRHLSFALRDLCGGYAHNSMAKQLIKARNLSGARLPEVFPPELAAFALHSLELGPNEKHLGEIVNRLARAADTSDKYVKQLAAARRTLAQAQAKRYLNARFDAQTGRIQLSGLDSTAQKMPLKPRERLEFRVHVQVAGIADLELADRGQHVRQGAYREYTLRNAPNPQAGQLTSWKEYSEEAFADGYALKLRLPEDGFKGTRLIFVAVEWRAVKGCRARHLKGAAIVRIAGSLPNENLAAKALEFKVPKPRRSTAHRESRRILLRTTRSIFSPKKPKKASRAASRPAIAQRE